MVQQWVLPLVYEAPKTSAWPHSLVGSMLMLLLAKYIWPRIVYAEMEGAIRISISIVNTRSQP